MQPDFQDHHTLTVDLTTDPKPRWKQWRDRANPWLPLGTLLLKALEFFKPILEPIWKELIDFLKSLE